ncbi:MAG TPA: ATP-dependent Clp protease proteolytic subunit [Azospirillum sp.]|nr:ATP-dependent Clp protease proteolytic subunit [Azospirillum sp.]
MRVGTFLKIPVLTAMLAVGASACASADSAAVARPPAPAALPDATLTQVDGGAATVLRIDGIITRGLEQRFTEALAALPRSRPLIVELSSPGGYTSAGYRMIDRLVAEREQGRAIATRVRAGEACESMCVGLYLAGYPRYAAPSAQFMVHAPRTADEGRMTLRMTQIMVNRLVSLGASTGWIERVKAAGGFSGAVDYRDSAEGLKAADANIVTNLEP